MPAKKKSRQTTKRMSTKALVAKALEFESNRKKKQKYDNKRKKFQTEIITELKRRRVRSTTPETEAGVPVKITLVQPERVNYDPDQLKDRLTPSKFRRVTKTVVDPDALAAEVQAGNIDVKDVEACSYVTETAPYINVTVGE